MSRNKDNYNFSDPYLKKMIQSLPLENTGAEFSNQIMNQVYASVEPVIDPSKYRRQMIWAYSLIGLGIMAVGLILFAIWPFFELDFKIDTSLILKFISASLGIVEGISNFFDYLKQSTLQLSIFFSVFILFLVERLLRKGLSSNNSYML